jgi:hypothetical protein
MVIMVVLALAVAGALYVLVRMVFAPRPQIALAAPFDVVGRNAPLALDIKDDHGLKHVRVTVTQGGRSSSSTRRPSTRPGPPRRCAGHPRRTSACG